jgi:hypothetical protein
MVKCKDEQYLEIQDMSLGFWPNSFDGGVLGVVRKSRGAPFFVFYCIFITKISKPLPFPCVHLWLNEANMNKIEIFFVSSTFFLCGFAGKTLTRIKK